MERYKPKNPTEVRVLKWVNSRRREFNLLPEPAFIKGIRRSASEDVLARSLYNGSSKRVERVAVTLEGTTYQGRFTHKAKYYPHPIYIRRFIRAFDAGYYPFLIATPDPDKEKEHYGDLPF